MGIAKDEAMNNQTDPINRYRHHRINFRGNAFRIRIQDVSFVRYLSLTLLPVVLLTMLLSNCTFYQEATVKQKEDRQKKELLAAYYTLEDYKKFTDLQKKLEMFEKLETADDFSACLPSDDKPDDWEMPDYCQEILPEECDPPEENQKEWEPSEECEAAINDEIGLGDDFDPTELPDTSDKPNVVNDYPGELPDTNSYDSGACYFDASDESGKKRDWCCYSILETECNDLYEYFDPDEDTYTPSFVTDKKSSADSCYDQGFVYCEEESLHCCYN